MDRLGKYIETLEHSVTVLPNGTRWLDGFVLEGDYDENETVLVQIIKLPKDD